MPLEAENGIKSQTKRGSFAANWWAKRWLTALQEVGSASRLSRGRRYARSGQVLCIEIDRGVIEAQVQGSRVRPYTCEIRIKPLPPEMWDTVAQAIARKPAIVAQLLAGDLPDTIEQVFIEAGTWLFPSMGRQMQTTCSCPDEANPCKHLAAVFFLLGEEFDRDPWQYLRLRGVTRGELLTRLQPVQPRVPAATPVISEGEALVACPAAFWLGGDLEEDACPGPLSTGREALFERLGPFPLWRGDVSLAEALQPVYHAAAQRAQAILIGEEPVTGELAAALEEPSPEMDEAALIQAARITNISGQREEFHRVLEFALATADFNWEHPEREVAMLYIQGLSQADVGRKLGVRNDFVRLHLLSIAKKVRIRLEEAD